MLQRALIVIVVTVCFASFCYADTPRTSDDARMDWWREARFGLFIHWGVYAVPAGRYDDKEVRGISEWIMSRANIPRDEYEKYAKDFNPTEFDADEWVQLTKDAGMKYLVITSKHHDGFAIFDSKATDWDIIDATPYKRDPLMELSKACEKQGVRFCTYYSIMDWHHPSQLPNKLTKTGRPVWNPSKIKPEEKAAYIKYMKAQLEPLVRDYKTNVLWFDGEWVGWWTEADGKELYHWLRGLNDDLLINNRVGKGRKGMEGLTKEGDHVGDFGTPEQQIPKAGLPGVDWESCMTMNRSWGYKVDDHNWKSSTQLIRNLIDTASKGGNYLLNVGPDAKGRIPKESIERLRDMGKWLKVNGEAIYGTQAGPIQPKWGRSTRKGKTVYLHVFDWPADGQLQVVGLNGLAKHARLLADPAAPLPVVSNEAGFIGITLPKQAPDAHASVVAVEVE